MINPFGNRLHLIAEIGVNHEGNIGRAKDLIQQASEAGCHSVKFQFYKAELLASNEAEAYWDRGKEPTKKQGALFSRYDSFNPDDYENLAAVAHSFGMDFGLSVFHLGGVPEVQGFVDYFKVASGDITYVQLLESIAATELPVVISTGAATASEIETAKNLFSGSRTAPVFLQCTLAYPSDLAQANISSLNGLREIVPASILGVSDHIQDGSQLRFQLAWALGARVFEKHFSDTPGKTGNDHYHSWGSDGFKQLVEAIDYARLQLGSGDLVLPEEEPARLGARRSLYFSRDLGESDIIRAEDLIALRPGGGLEPGRQDEIVGKSLVKSVHAGDRVRTSMF